MCKHNLKPQAKQKPPVEKWALSTTIPQRKGGTRSTSPCTFFFYSHYILPTVLLIAQSGHTQIQHPHLIISNPVLLSDIQCLSVQFIAVLGR